MDWISAVTANTVRAEVHAVASSAADDTESVAVSIGGVGGAVVGLVVGSIFGPVGMMVGASLCSKVGAEGASSAVHTVKYFPSTP